MKTIRFTSFLGQKTWFSILSGGDRGKQGIEDTNLNESYQVHIISQPEDVVQHFVWVDRSKQGIQRTQTLMKSIRSTSFLSQKTWFSILSGGGSGKQGTQRTQTLMKAIRSTSFLSQKTWFSILSGLIGVNKEHRGHKP